LAIWQSISQPLDSSIPFFGNQQFGNHRILFAISNQSINGLLISRKTKIKLYKLSVSNPSALNILKFKNFRNLYNSTIRAAKKLYFEKTFKKFQSNLKKSWDILYSAVNKNPILKKQ
jgi:hypothetical protein